MPHFRLVTPMHPAAAPLLAGLRHEYQTIYGPAVAAELDAYSVYDFFPPAGAFLLLESEGITLAGGALQTAAIGLYESSGYEPVGPWGPYADDPPLLSFEKRLDVRDDLATHELDRGEVIVRKMLEHHTLHARLREAA
jgi:hypothetical protein